MRPRSIDSLPTGEQIPYDSPKGDCVLKISPNRGARGACA
ncbi:hypothetical protein PORUE0001_0644 [Porphyromonas uenonis 60-3]|uniref:Uncharacterized protein n=1 Tax=Porphyromonas uenonis 60-3 TaxID=596327 RepID=C2MBG7_9PORP|nr:hypothetical protein PORUE0001_0644 [Porphyromonas uenonis 60-3]